MTKAKPLTPEQKQIARSNPQLFAEQIAKLPGMEGTNKRQIADYLRRPVNNPYKDTADAIEKVISIDGLPRQYVGILEYVRYLRSKA